jgi:hypothetical protein
MCISRFARTVFKQCILLPLFFCFLICTVAFAAGSGNSKYACCDFALLHAAHTQTHTHTHTNTHTGSFRAHKIRHLSANKALRAEVLAVDVYQWLMHGFIVQLDFYSWQMCAHVHVRVISNKPSVLCVFVWVLVCRCGWSVCVCVKYMSLKRINVVVLCRNLRLVLL